MGLQRFRFVSHKSDDTKSDIVVKGVHPFEERERERERERSYKQSNTIKFPDSKVSDTP